MKVDVSNCPSPHSFGNKVGRVMWGMVWLVLFRPSPKPLHAWRRWLLRAFGAQIGRGVHIQSSVRVWAPWNLTMEDHSCLSFDVDCYCVAPVFIGAHTTVSQYSYLCTASHDIRLSQMPLTTAAITVGRGAWVAADVFVAPGVRIGDGAVVAAKACVTKDVLPWTIVGGNPARFIKRRELRG